MHQNKNQNKKTQHEAVLLEQVLKYLSPKSGESLLDLTAGYGGHSQEILALTGSLIQSVLIDRDINAIKYLKEIFPSDTVEIRQQDFLNATKNLVAENRRFDLILADLGVSSPHLNEGNRGFSIKNDGPLDMRMDQSQELTARHILNKYTEANLAKILSEFGEEPKAKRIAKLIVSSRPISSTSELSTIAIKAWPGKSRVHPATRTFQSIRIAVNDELSQLEQSMPMWIKMLNPGGRIAVISFHSLEDRIVKRILNDYGGKSYDAEIEILTKHPVSANPDEIVLNPRARSAKLRAAVKINKKGN